MTKPSMIEILGKIRRSKTLFQFDNRWQLLINRLFWPNHGPAIYRLGELEIFIDHSAGDQDGTRSCLVPGLYNPCLSAIKDLPKDLVVADLGSNGGGFLLFLKHKGYTIRRAVAVELNPHTWSRLVLNIYRNIPDALQNITLLNGAAGGDDRKIEVSLGRGSVGDSISTESNTGAQQYRVPQFSLESIIRQIEPEMDIDLCKIDIEGAEYDLLDNTDRTCLRRCRHLVIEIHDVAGRSAEALKEQICAYGFQEIKPYINFIETNVFIFSRN